MKREGCINGLDVGEIVRLIRAAFPEIQAIHLFGSFASGDFRPTSDVDLALLLPPKQAKQSGSFYLTELHRQLEQTLRRDVDLINLREVSTVLQKEVVMNGIRIDCQKQYSADEFEMLVLSFYQKLNEERAEVISDGLRTGHFY